jgi:hypothetical protein
VSGNSDYFGPRFFNLVALLWSTSPAAGRAESQWDRQLNQDSMWGFIYLLFFISSVRVHQGTHLGTDYHSPTKAQQNIQCTLVSACDSAFNKTGKKSFPTSKCAKTVSLTSVDNAGVHSHQSCQMVYFQTKNPNLGKF